MMLFHFGGFNLGWLLSLPGLLLNVFQCSYLTKSATGFSNSWVFLLGLNVLLIFSFLFSLCRSIFCFHLPLLLVSGRFAYLYFSRYFFALSSLVINQFTILSSYISLSFFSSSLYCLTHLSLIRINNE